MAEPELVGDCVAAMRARVSIPVTVKCRIGIDDQDAEADFQRFIDSVARAGCTTFIVHARKAWLSGLSPKENREIPPLDYERVYRLKAARPDLEIVINGGITSLGQCDDHLNHVDGVMLGRAAYQDPYILAGVDRRFFDPAAEVPDRAEALSRLRSYVSAHLDQGGKLNNITRHVLGLYHGRPRAKAFRRMLGEGAVKPGAGVDLLDAAVAVVEGVRLVPDTAAAE
jgi:tRNA-dihydrouridine synthase A